MTRTASRMIGDAKVTVLTDGAFTFPPELFPGTDPAHIDDLVKTAHAMAIDTNFNAVLIETGGKTVLCDAGPRDLFGPSAGFLQDALAETGTAPADIDLLYATHLHPDHIAGMVSGEGAAVFPNAELVVTRGEAAFWGDESKTAPLPDDIQGWAQLARAVLAAYGDRLRVIDGEGEIASGITSFALPGHTPGHSGWRLSSGDATLVHAGDIIHAPYLQAADPEIAIAFDMDSDTARATRKRLLDELATEGAMFTGGHFLHPAFHKAVRQGAGYRLEQA